jgi:hypothetical protein
MEDVSTQLHERLKNLLSDWKSVSAIGVAVLYVVGYLSLRFHMTAIGISTELALLDERYLFAGARVLIYLGLSTCVLVLLAILLVPLAYLLKIIFSRVMPSQAESSRPDGIVSARTKALLGLIVSIAMIQFVMVKSFDVHDVLLKGNLPSPSWLQHLMLTDITGERTLFFAGLLLAVGFCAGCWIDGQRRPIEDSLTRGLYHVLIFLVFVQALLIPANHGILVADKTIPRVEVPEGIDDPEKSKIAWLIWEGKESITFLVWDVKSTSPPQRALTTLLRREVKAVTVKDYDHCYRVLCTEEGQKAAVRRALEQRLVDPNRQ